jgi:hypothetical protein
MNTSMAEAITDLQFEILHRVIETIIGYLDGLVVAPDVCGVCIPLSGGLLVQSSSRRRPLSSRTWRMLFALRTIGILLGAPGVAVHKYRMTTT